MNNTKNISFALFNSQASEYDAHNAYLLAQLSLESYRKTKLKALSGKDEDNNQWRERLQQEALGWGFKHVYCFNNKGSQAILVADDQKIIVAFRGSEEIDDWKMNMNRLRDKDFCTNNKICVHTGFCNYVNNIWKPYDNKYSQGQAECKGIKAIIQELMQESPRTLWFTGHSLGGAAAILAAATCIWDDSPLEVSGVYTYGQPRVGDLRFAKLYNTQLKSKTFRFVNNNDVVTRIPTWAPLFLFSHVGQIKYLTQEGEILDFDKYTWWKRLQYLFLDIAEDLRHRGLDSITDHCMVNGYTPPLRNAVSQQAAQA